MQSKNGPELGGDIGKKMLKIGYFLPALAGIPRDRYAYLNARSSKWYGKRISLGINVTVGVRSTTAETMRGRVKIINYETAVQRK